jgi:dTDP-4-amino-4,6-dideoxygalactose transaminase
MIPYGKQSINQSDIDAVVNVLRGDWLTTGPAVEKFEFDLQKFTGGVPVVSVSSGTAALHCAYVAAGIGPGDEVITPPLTFIATQATAAMCGAKIVFSDIQPDTGNIDPLQIEEKITSRTKAIVAVDYAGHPADLDEIRKICDKYNLIFIEDASHAIGGKYKNKAIGGCQYSHITVFSFHPVKIITTGEGGMCLTNDPKLAIALNRYRSHGIVRQSSEMTQVPDGPWYYQQIDLGYNYRMNDIQAALGIEQIKRLDKNVSKRNLIAKRYDKAFEDLPLYRPWKSPNTYSALHLYVITLHQKYKKKQTLK